MPKEFPAGANTHPHAHPRAQLLFAAQGVMRVTTPQGFWVLPPLRALWVPPLVEHNVSAVSPVSMRTLYIDTGAANTLWTQCRVIEVSALLRELILSLTAEPVAYSLNGRAGLIAALILAELSIASVVPTQIPWPQDRRLQTVCRAIMHQPGLTRTVHSWGEEAGASGRTLIRLFQAELGMNYRQWVQQVRLADAVCRLTLGEPVARIASALGYRSPSAFSAMFRRALGTAPNVYVSGMT